MLCSLGAPSLFAFSANRAGACKTPQVRVASAAPTWANDTPPKLVIPKRSEESAIRRCGHTDGTTVKERAPKTISNFLDGTQAFGRSSSSLLHKACYKSAKFSRRGKVSQTPHSPDGAPRSRTSLTWESATLNPTCPTQVKERRFSAASTPCNARALAPEARFSRPREPCMKPAQSFWVEQQFTAALSLLQDRRPAAEVRCSEHPTPVLREVPRRTKQPPSHQPCHPERSQAFTKRRLGAVEGPLPHPHSNVGRTLLSAAFVFRSPDTVERAFRPRSAQEGQGFSP